MYYASFKAELILTESGNVNNQPVNSYAAGVMNEMIFDGSSERRVTTFLNIIAPVTDNGKR